MKEPIEELFKQSLEGHELPYNPAAWKAMSARLDVVSPVVTPTSYLKYYIGAAGIGVAAVATYILFAGGSSTQNNTTPVANETKTEQTTAVEDKSTTTNRDTESKSTTITSNSSKASTSSENESQANEIMKSNADSKTQSNVAPNDIMKGTDAKNGSTQTGPSITDLKEDSNGPAPTKTDFNQKMTVPTINDLCLNEEIMITNPNGKEIYILDGLNNPIKTIPANKSVVFKPSKVGNYSLGYRNNETLKSVSNFQVNRIPDADFTVDLVNKYENGLPLTHVEAISGQGTYIWNAKNQSADGVEADLHFYKKGEQTIELTVNNGQCASTIEKTIFIEDDYNLMAVTGFRPMSNEPRNNTFMPFALTERDVRFILTIIDGRDGGTVYETSDASLPWDGTDIRSGKRSSSPQVYVWKAVILNPAANEPSEYRGTITMN